MRLQTHYTHTNTSASSALRIRPSTSLLVKLTFRLTASQLDSECCYLVGSRHDISVTNCWHQVRYARKFRLRANKYATEICAKPLLLTATFHFYFQFSLFFIIFGVLVPFSTSTDVTNAHAKCETEFFFFFFGLLLTDFLAHSQLT